MGDTALLDRDVLADAESTDAAHGAVADEGTAAPAAGIDEAQYADRPIMQRILRMRERVSRHPRLELGYRVLVAVVGGSLTLAGAMLLALPGPGWLTVFLGLAILGTEFHWAQRISGWLKRQLQRFWAWWNRRRARKAPAERR